MITFEVIISEKDKEKRDLLIKNKLDELNSTTKPIKIDTNSIVTGFISNESHVYFSELHYDLNMGLGSIYGMKSDDYFFEFFDFLIQNNFSSKRDVITYLSPFLKKYFDEPGIIKNNRELLFDDIWSQLDNMSADKERFEKCKESWLDIGIFKGRSAAECTEHTVISQNLLTFCDIDSCYIAGNMQSVNSNGGHAFNIIKYNNEFYLADTANPVCLFSSNDEYSGCKTYVHIIDYEQFYNFIYNKTPINLPKCNCMRNRDGKLLMMDVQDNEYTTSSKIVNKDQFNAFLNNDNIKSL